VRYTFFCKAKTHRKESIRGAVTKKQQIMEAFHKTPILRLVQNNIFFEAGKYTSTSITTISSN